MLTVDTHVDVNDEVVVCRPTLGGVVRHGVADDANGLSPLKELFAERGRARLRRRGELAGDALPDPSEHRPS